ncbi:transcriptional regulator [Rummeliibacillus sp. JY-2-4R]
MRKQLIKAMENNQLLTIMYLSKKNEISKRRVKILKITERSFTAYCFTKKAKRIFIIENLLAVAPVIENESDII